MSNSFFDKDRNVLLDIISKVKKEYKNRELNSDEGISIDSELILDNFLYTLDCLKNEIKVLDNWFSGNISQDEYVNHNRETLYKQRKASNIYYQFILGLVRISDKYSKSKEVLLTVKDEESLASLFEDFSEPPNEFGNYQIAGHIIKTILDKESDVKIKIEIK